MFRIFRHYSSRYAGVSGFLCRPVFPVFASPAEPPDQADDSKNHNKENHKYRNHGNQPDDKIADPCNHTYGIIREPIADSLQNRRLTGRRLLLYLINCKIDRVIINQIIIGVQLALETLDTISDIGQF